MAYPPSLFKTYTEGETLTASDLNSSMTDIVNLNIPEDIDDYSANTTEMRAVVDPYPGAAASLPSNLAGELARLRYQFAALLGETYWYIDPDVSIATLDTFKTQVNTLIGTSSTVAGFPDGSASAPPVASATTTGAGMFFGTNIVGVATDGVERLNIDAVGKVKIGPGDSYANKLQLTGASYDTEEILLSLNPHPTADRGWNFKTGANTDAVWGAYSLRLYPYDAGNTGDFVMAKGNGNLKIGSGTASVAGSTSGFTEQFRIDSSGKVGIGTTPAYAPLCINGVSASPGNTSGLVIKRNHASPTGASNYGHIYLFTPDAATYADRGASISLGGMYDGTYDTRWGVIQGYKHNTTSPDFSGGLRFYTRYYPAGPALGLQIDRSGIVTKPNQPSFLLTNNTVRTDCTGAGVVYSIIFDTEVYDTNSDVTSSVFTAPVAGVYKFDLSAYTGNGATAYTNGELRLVCSSRGTFKGGYKHNPYLNGSVCTFQMTLTIQLAASETVTPQIVVEGNVQDIDLDAGKYQYTRFAGVLLG